MKKLIKNYLELIPNDIEKSERCKNIAKMAISQLSDEKILINEKDTMTWLLKNYVNFMCGENKEIAKMFWELVEICENHIMRSQGDGSIIHILPTRCLLALENFYRTYFGEKNNDK